MKTDSTKLSAELRLPPETLVDLVIRGEANFKFVGIHLDTTEPDAAAASRVVEAYDKGRSARLDERVSARLRWAPAGIRHVANNPRGSSRTTCRELRRTRDDQDPRRGRVWGSRDPVAKQHATRREGAAYGLARQGTLQATQAILQAAVDQFIHHQMGSTLAGLPVTARQIEELLESDIERTVWIALHYLAALVRSNNLQSKTVLAAGRSLWTKPLRHVLDERKVRISPAQRTILNEWCLEG